MPELFVYLLKVNLALVLFYLVYHLLLRKLTFYSINRFYLLLAFGFSAIYPLVNLREWFAKAREIPVEVYIIVPDWEAVQSSSFSIWPYLNMLFWSVVIFFVLRFAIRLFSLWQIHRASVPATWQFFHYRHVMQKINPFTFWKNIYVHVESHHDQELVDIFHHEQVHVEQLHTVDTLIAEICTLFCWFNPVSWLMRHAVRENLEFITDRRVIRSGVDKRTYQYSLLNLGTQGAPDGLVSHFNLKHLKNRILMMNKKKSSSAHLGKYVLGVPLIVLLATVFTWTRAHERSADNAEEMNLMETKSDRGELLYLMTEENREERALGISDTTRSGREGVTTLILRPESTTRKDSVRKDSVRLIFDRIDHRDKRSRPLVVLNAEVVDNFELNGLVADQIESISILKGQSAMALYGEYAQAINGVIIIVTKSGSGKVSSDKTGAHQLQPVAERVVTGRRAAADSVAVRVVTGKPYAVRIEGRKVSSDSAGVKVVEGRPVTIGGDPLLIKGAAVIKTEGVSVENTGSRIVLRGRGIIEGDPTSDTGGVDGQDRNVPYILIDGEKGELSSLVAEQIESINVIKGDTNTVRIYGPSAAHGVVKIITKK